MKPQPRNCRTRSAAVAGNLAERAGAGGHWWAIGHWALGLQELGFRVGVLGGASDRDSGVAEAAEQLGLAEAFRFSAQDEWVFRIMGFHDERESDASLPSRSVFVDIDPGYPQMWFELGLADMFDGCDRFVTIGENIGRDGCTVPVCGLDWVVTPPPVVLDAWPATAGGTAYTTVATWRNPYGTVIRNGQTYGSRVHEFRSFMELPRLVDAEFELALDIEAAEVEDLAALERNGWRLVDPKQMAGTPAAYRSYIQQSRAEICVAQNIYVATRSGWLSDRSLCYLASGKPVLAQDTGFSDNYPVGEGLVAFSTLDEAAAGVEEIERNYERHSRAARELAEEYFDSRKVLSRLLKRLEEPVEAERK